MIRRAEIKDIESIVEIIRAVNIKIV